jgi:transcriptional regulator with XRE-family HTH domain
MIETMQKRINEIKQQDRKSYYEIANEIGISESTLYKLMSKGELFTPAEQKITAYLKGYLTKDEKLEAYRMDNEELKAENDRLKEENYQLQKDCQICENFIDFIPCKPIRDMDYDLQKVINQRDNYYQTLQEIKAIAESAMAKQQEYKKDFEQILDLITKAEEE